MHAGRRRAPLGGARTDRQRASRSTSLSSTCTCPRWMASSSRARSHRLKPELPLVLAHLARSASARSRHRRVRRPADEARQGLGALRRAARGARRAASRQAARQTATCPASAPERLPLRILLAEDNAVNQKLALLPARAARLRGRRGRERPRGDRGARAPAVRRRPHGRADAGDGRDRGDPADRRALARRGAGRGSSP